MPISSPLARESEAVCVLEHFKATKRGLLPHLSVPGMKLGREDTHPRKVKKPRGGGAVSARKMQGRSQPPCRKEGYSRIWNVVLHPQCEAARGGSGGKGIGELRRGLA